MRDEFVRSERLPEVAASRIVEGLRHRTDGWVTGDDDSRRGHTGGPHSGEKLEAVQGVWHRNSDPEKHKLVMDRMMTASGCNVLFHTHIVDAIVANGEIRGVVVESKAGRKAVLAKRVIDCSGDADAAAFAGCGFDMGRPGDGLVQACSLEFRLGGVDWDTYNDSELKANDPRWYTLLEKCIADGEVPPIENHLNWITHVPGRPEHQKQDEVSICICHSRNCHPLDNHDLTRMYIEGREQVDTMWKWIRSRIPGFENCWVIDTGVLLGVRDSRRVHGAYTLTTYDIASRAKFDDVVAISYRAYDIHNPDALGNLKWAPVELNGEQVYMVVGGGGYIPHQDMPPGGVVVDYLGRPQDHPEHGVQPEPRHYDVPYRSLVPTDVDNLLVAGRCLSSDFPAQSATRLVMCCNAMGEAAGTATALSLKHDIPPRKVDVAELQKTLVANGCDLGQDKREIPNLA